MPSVGLTARNLVAYWLLGLCNNFAYVIMLSAAKDILKRQEGTIIPFPNATAVGKCEEDITSRNCAQISTGAVLLADILPTLIIKLIAPFFMHRIPFGVRHLVVVVFQASSFIIVALSAGIGMSLSGVIFASIAAGLGEITYLAMAAHFPKDVISTWSSGTGGAGIVGALAYAGLTEPYLFNLTPRTTLLILLVVPMIFAVAFWFVLVVPASVHQVAIANPRTWLVPTNDTSSSSNICASCSCFCRRRNQSYSDLDSADDDNEPLLANSGDDGGLVRHDHRPRIRRHDSETPTFTDQLQLIFVELIFFDCAHGMYLARESQYRWYQVVYQLGVFISRSSVNLIQISVRLLPLLAVLQVL
uniref:Battenin n=1 Tax=Plectus sambesii TaxID=2011161 RepID=A0A914XQK0_9BILA